MWVPSRSQPFELTFRRGLVPGSLAILVLLGVALRPPLWAMILMATVVPLYLAYEWFRLPQIKKTFEAAFNRALMREDAATLWTLMADARFLRFAAPAGYVDERKGLVHALQAEWYQADRFLEYAFMKSQKKDAKLRLLPTIMRVKYENSLFDEAEAIARMLVGRTSYPGPPELFLGLTLARKDAGQDQARVHLKMALEHLSGKDKILAEGTLASINKTIDEAGPGDVAGPGDEAGPSDVAGPGDEAGLGDEAGPGEASQ